MRFIELFTLSALFALMFVSFVCIVTLISSFFYGG